MSNSSKAEHSTKLSFLICLYKDLEKFINILPCLLETARSKLKQQSPAVLKLLEGNKVWYYHQYPNLLVHFPVDSLGETTKNLTTILPRVTEEISNELLKQCVTHLKQVSDIPRLFRRTKRDVPTKPCAYVRNALASLISFHSDYKRVIPDNVNCWLELALSSLTEQ